MVWFWVLKNSDIDVWLLSLFVIDFSILKIPDNLFLLGMHISKIHSTQLFFHLFTTSDVHLNDKMGIINSQ